MPILATVRNQGGRRPRVIPVDDRRLEFHNLDGSDLIAWNDRDYILRSGIQGLRMAPREVITESVSELPGARLREVRTLTRAVVLPFLVDAGSGDYRDHLAQLARMRSFMDFRSVDYAGEEGTFDLVAVAGASQRSLRCVYVDGMEGVDGVEDGAGSDWSTFDVQLLAVDPFWRGLQWTTPPVALPVPAPFISDDPAFTFGNVGITASVALGADMPVHVGGDVPSPAVIEGVGPWTSLHITSPQGLDVTIGAVSSGQTFLLDTGRRKRCELDGVKDWSLTASDSPQWYPLPPGNASISIEAVGASSSTAIRVYGTELWETAW